MQISDEQLKQLIEACLFVQSKPIALKELKSTLLAQFSISIEQIRNTIESLQQDYQDRGVQLVKVADGYRFQSREDLSPYLQTLWQEKSPKYSRATLETLAVIAYRQPVTRGDIEQVRGVTVGSHTIKILTDRNWVRIVGHKEVPGRPALYATTLEFLSYFGLDTLADLPPLTDPDSLAALFSNKEQGASQESESQQLDAATET